MITIENEMNKEARLTKIQPQQKIVQHDEGLAVLLMLLQYLKEPVTSDEITEISKNKTPITADILTKILKDQFKFKVCRKKQKLQQLKAVKTPLVVLCNAGQLKLLLPGGEEKSLVFDPKTKNTNYLNLEEFSETYTGETLQIEKRESQSQRQPEIPQGAFGIKWIFSALLGYKNYLIQILIGALLIQIFALVTPLFTMVIIDKVFSASGLSTLHVLIFGLFAISFFDFLISGSRQVLLNHTTHKVDFMTSSSFFKQLTCLPMSFFSSRQIGDSVSRVKELEVIRNFFTGSAFTVLIDFPFLVVFIGVMFMFSVNLTVVALLFVCFIFLIYGVFGPFIRERLKQKNEIQSDNQSFLIEMISGIEILKSMSLENNVQSRWNKLLINQSKNSVKTENLTGKISQFTGFLTKSTTAVCLWLGALQVLEGQMTAGQLIAFNMMVGRIIVPTQRISQMLQQLHQLKVSFKRIGEIMDAPSEPFIKNQSELPSLEGSIKFKSVAFQYLPDKPEVLSDISFEVKAGEVIGVIGSTGSGKTTLIRLLQRLYLPTKGHIYIDGINIAGVNPFWFREKIGVVSQDNLLFNLSLKENILMANSGIPEEKQMDRIVEVCKLVGADQWIRALPQAYDTIVGEKGLMLSTGQRQKIAIVRALLNDPKILIFDEATSALDYESEQFIQHNMKEICKGRTVFIVAHRLPTLRMANRILGIEGGELIENDTIPALLRDKNSRFNQLLKIQTKIIA